MTEAAEADLAEIWAYIASEASKPVATQFLSDIGHALQPLLQMPLVGARREHLGAGLRVIFHNPYAIYYLTTETEVVIIRVLHGARDVVAIASQGGLAE